MFNNPDHVVYCTYLVFEEKLVPRFSAILSIIT